jgi:hypothetical protein
MAPPDGSVTVPESVAPVTCACAATPKIKMKHRVTATAKAVANFLEFPTPMQSLPDDRTRGSSIANGLVQRTFNRPDFRNKTPRTWGHLSTHTGISQAFSRKFVLFSWERQSPDWRFGSRKDANREIGVPGGSLPD